MIAIRVFATVVLVTFSSGAAAGEERRELSLPNNIAFPEAIHRVVEGSVTLSPTLQRQFAAITVTRAHVDVLVSPAALPAFRRAETTISRYKNGFIKAQIVLPPGEEFGELLAHELEHVLEQIERVDLPALVRAGLAHRDGHGVYETVRAQQAGVAASAEIAAARRALRAAP